MREKLRQFLGLNLRFQAKLIHFDTRKGIFLLREIRLLKNGLFVADHIWLPVRHTEKFKRGDRIAFDAWVSTYVKGYVDHEMHVDYRSKDFNLTRPSKFQVLSSAT